jgi:uracil-DNA glycosylase family 4
MSWGDYECEACSSEDCVPFVGSGKIMLLGSQPGRDEISQGQPYVGAAGEILRQELAYHGLDIYACRLGNLWLHEPAKPPNRKKETLKLVAKQNEACLAYSVKKILKKAKKCKAILLIGAPSVKYFTGYNVSEVNGLKVKSDMLSAPLIMACVQSASVFHGGVGEFRLAIRKFVQELEKAKLL